ncbi:MAG: HD domain-containing protein [Thermofilaceae archaeon]
MSELQVEVCREVARQILGYSRALFPFFVLHDFTHSENICCNLCELAKLFGITEWELNLLKMAAYLHDIGMALPPLVIDELNINIENVLRDIKKENRERMRGKISCFSRFIENNYVRLGKHALTAVEDAARLVRLLHPFISSSFIRRHLRDEIGVNLPQEVELLCRYHNSKTPIPSSDERLRRLVMALRLADSMDFTWARGKYFFTIAWRQCLLDAVDQLKHWAFKLSVEDVRVRGDSITVKVSEGASRASVLGVLLFEVANNFYEDWQEIYSCGLETRVVVSKGGNRVEVTGFIEALNSAYKRVVQGYGGFDSSREFENICSRLEGAVESGMLDRLRDAHRRWRRESCAPEVSIFDALALAVSKGVDIDDVVDRILSTCVNAPVRERIKHLF